MNITTENLEMENNFDAISYKLTAQEIIQAFSTSTTFHSEKVGLSTTSDTKGLPDISIFWLQTLRNLHKLYSGKSRAVQN